ncbi:MAG: sulfurtransferase TusA family protein [Candidatus Micrarchaeia archaeon]
MTKKVVDSRGSACPGPITDLALAYRNASTGDEIELWATDPGVKADTRAWAERTGNVIESVTEQPDKIVVLIKIVKK